MKTRSFVPSCIFVFFLAIMSTQTATATPFYTMASGDKIPAIGLGTWQSEPEKVKMAVKEAIKLGYRHIDCAAVYGNEKQVGEALQECFQENIVERKDLWITSKLWNDSHEPHKVIPALKKTLHDLGLDYLDLYLVHWPVALKEGHGFPPTAEELLPVDLEKTWYAMERTMDKGMARHIGVSNFSVKKLQDMLKIARIKPEVNQVERHPYLQQKDLASFCKANSIHITNYSSLGSPGRPDDLKPSDEPALLEDPTIVGIAMRVGASPAAVLLKWALLEGASVIPKSVTPERIKQNLEIDQIALVDEDMEKIRQMDRKRRYVDGLFWCADGSPYTIESMWDEEVPSPKIEL